MSSYQEPDKTARAGGDSVERVAYLVKRVQASLRVALDDAFEPLDLSVAQWAILEAIREIPDAEATNAAIARRCFITPQSANEMIAAMTRRRLVSRRTDAGPRRIRYSLTERGSALRIAAHERSLEVEERMLAGQSAAERMRLADLLKRCVTALGGRP